MSWHESFDSISCLRLHFDHTQCANHLIADHGYFPQGPLELIGENYWDRREHTGAIGSLLVCSRMMLHLSDEPTVQLGQGNSSRTYLADTS